MNLAQSNFLRIGLATVLLCVAAPVVYADAFVANHIGRSVMRYDDSGHFLGRYRTGFEPVGMTFGPDGGLYVSEGGGSHVSRFDPATGVLASFTSGGSMSNPHQTVFGGPGNDMYVADPASASVYRFDGSSGAFEQRIEGVGSQATGVAVDAAGTVYVSTRTGTIYKWSAGTLLTFATASMGYEALTIGPDGNLYTGTYFGSRVLRYKPDGTPFGIDGSTTNPTFINDSRLAFAFSVTFAPDGGLYVVDSVVHDQVLRFGADGAFIDTFISNAHGLVNPTYLAFGSFAPPPVPEPATWMLAALGLAAVGSTLRRRVPSEAPRSAC